MFSEYSDLLDLSKPGNSMNVKWMKKKKKHEIIRKHGVASLGFEGDLVLTLGGEGVREGNKIRKTNIWWSRKGVQTPGYGTAGEWIYNWGVNA